ncbi:mediator complex, subunit Med10 [Amylocarpus encephaloides]|uniref:Mediator of RNA polymerase II transcription subunit 10 n=1 Tax=Amylocarpus encephaloides TaxID=45428 RepID=A0A9P8C5J0_9HELO|nr:mediator complex, subunit Med10 [Amylocarpus encephaloides]
MAPVGQSDHDVIERQLKDIIQDLYQTMIQVNAYDMAGRPTEEVLKQQIEALLLSLQKVARSSKTISLPLITGDLINYIDNGRNPDIYTREFVELVRRSNQLMKGKEAAFRSFRDVLAEEMGMGMPELKEDVRGVLESTGGVDGGGGN